MNKFIRCHEESITGCVQGFDRLLFRGTLRMIANERGMMNWLWRRQILLKDSGAYAERTTERLKNTSIAVAQAAGRPVQYVRSSAANKEAIAREIAERDGIKDGLVCVLTSVHTGMGYGIRRDADRKQLRIEARPRNCLHVYHYMIHPVVGWMVAWLQTWFPLTVKVCLNGREWLAREMERAGLGFVRRDNCFVHIDDCREAQRLLDKQLRTTWSSLLDEIVRTISPGHAEVFADDPLRYYWSADESEYATDLMFRSPEVLSMLYPKLVRHAMVSMSSVEVMRFLGRRSPPIGSSRGIHGKFNGEIVSDVRKRPEGMRIKHRRDRNSIKMYDKQGSVLRVETTINNPRDYRVYRRPADQGKPACRRMRKGVSDLHRRATVSKAANRRYFNGLATADISRSVEELAAPVCRRKRDAKGRSVRALNPLDRADAALLEAVGRGEFNLNGFRNADIRTLLFGADTEDPTETRRRSGKVSRQLRLLREHGLIRKVRKTYRHTLTERGRAIILALLAAKAASVQQLNQAA